MLRRNILIILSCILLAVSLNVFSALIGNEKLLSKEPLSRYMEEETEYCLCQTGTEIGTGHENRDADENEDADKNMLLSTAIHASDGDYTIDPLYPASIE